MIVLALFLTAFRKRYLARGFDVLDNGFVSGGGGGGCEVGGKGGAGEVRGGSCDVGDRWSCCRGRLRGLACQMIRSESVLGVETHFSILVGTVGTFMS